MFTQFAYIKLYQAGRELLAQLKNWYHRLTSPSDLETDDEEYHKFLEQREEEERQLDRENEERWLAEPCARCSHSRDEHLSWGHDHCLACQYAQCDHFVEQTEFTSQMLADWETKTRRAKIQEELELVSEYYESTHNDSLDDEDYVDERRYQWGEPFELHYYHPQWGNTSLGMLEGEWIQSFKDMRKTKSLPEDQIQNLERLFEQAREQWYQQFQEDNEEDWDSLQD